MENLKDWVNNKLSYKEKVSRWLNIMEKYEQYQKKEIKRKNQQGKNMSTAWLK